MRACMYLYICSVYIRVAYSVQRYCTWAWMIRLLAIYHAYVCVFMHVRACVRYVSLCACVYTYTCMYTYIHAYIHTFIIHTCIHSTHTLIKGHFVHKHAYTYHMHDTAKAMLLAYRSFLHTHAHRIRVCLRAYGVCLHFVPQPCVNVHCWAAPWMFFCC